MEKYNYLKQIDYVDENWKTNQLMILVNENKALKILPTINLTKEEIKNIIDWLNKNWNKREDFYNFRDVEKSEENIKKTKEINNNNHDLKLQEMFELYQEIILVSKSLNSKTTKIKTLSQNGIIPTQEAQELSLESENFKKLIQNFEHLTKIYPDFFEEKIKKYTTWSNKTYYIIYWEYHKIIDIINPLNPKEKVNKWLRNTIEDNAEKVTPIIKNQRNSQILKIHSLYKNPDIKKIIYNDFCVFSFENFTKTYFVHFYKWQITKIHDKNWDNFKNVFHSDIELKLKNSELKDFSLEFYIDNNFLSNEIEVWINKIEKSENDNKTKILINNFIENIYEFLAYKKANLQIEKKLETIKQYIKKYLPTQEENLEKLIQIYKTL